MAVNTGDYWNDYKNKNKLSDEELRYFQNYDYTRGTNGGAWDINKAPQDIKVKATEESWKHGADAYWNDIRRQYADMIKPLTSDLQANQDAGSQAEQTAQTDAIAANLAGINAGMNAGRAGLLGDVAGNSNINAVANATYQNSVSNAGQTQQDYLSKMGQMDAMCCCARNLERGQGLNVASGILQGAGTGAKLGAGF